MRRLLLTTALALAASLLAVPAHAAQDPDVRLTRFRFDDVVMSHATSDGFAFYTRITGVVGTTFSPGSGYQPVSNAVTTGLRVNGRAPADPSFTNIGYGFRDGGRQRVGSLVPLTLGPGRYVVGPVNLAITTTSGDRDVPLPVSDSFFVRQPTVAAIAARRFGNQVRLRITSQTRYWKTWTLVRSDPRARVERKVGGRWRLVANVPLTKAGKATKRITSSTRHRYRVRIVQTGTRVGTVAVSPKV